MKRNYLIIVLSLLLVQTGFAQDKLLDLFSKLEGQENVTQVTITKSMLNMITSKNSPVDMNGLDVKKIIPKLDQIDIFTSDNTAMAKMMAKETTEYFKTIKDYEVLMKIKEGNDNIVFYGIKDNNNLFTSLVMFVHDGSSCTIIRLLGKFTPKDIQDVTKNIEK